MPALRGNCVERSDQNVGGLFREAEAQYLLISHNIGAARNGSWRLNAEGARLREFVERLLLQALGIKLDRLDLGAEGLLLRRRYECRRTLQLAAHVADR